jgi:hypothetical protein
MSREHGFDITTELAASAEHVWARVTGVEGVNDELMPVMRMTVPRGLENATLEQLPLGEPAGRSWVLLFGLLPVDYDDLTIAERGPGSRFLERSTMLTQASWSHERTVEPVAGGCRVTDHLRWRGRIPPLGAMYAIVVPRLFRHRHRRLAKRFGVVPA